MKVAVLKEHAPLEARVAATPETVKKLIDLGLKVCIEQGAGEKASFPDKDYKAVGATLAASAKATCDKADIVLKVNGPTDKECAHLAKGTHLIGILNPYDEAARLKKYASQNVTSFAMELMPRITKAQSMDVLSSQSNLAGYLAVVEAAAHIDKAFPMMMTAAGTIAPAKVLVIGAGVAGLQAIATAKRLGAVVFAFDVRKEVKEQVESLGGKFVEVESDEEGSSAGGYAKEMSSAYKKRQSQRMAEEIAKSDIVITTALIPGKPAPKLITEAMVKSMKPGSVIVDLATVRGGNCDLSQPDKIVTKHDVDIIGHSNFPSRIARDAAQLYARNILNFLKYVVKEGKLALDFEDEIIKGICLTHGGKIVHEKFKSTSAKKPAKTASKKAPPKKKITKAKAKPKKGSK